MGLMGLLVSVFTQQTNSRKNYRKIVYALYSAIAYDIFWLLLTGHVFFFTWKLTKSSDLPLLEFSTESKLYRNMQLANIHHHVHN